MDLFWYFGVVLDINVYNFPWKCLIPWKKGLQCGWLELITIIYQCKHSLKMAIPFLYWSQSSLQKSHHWATYGIKTWKWVWIIKTPYFIKFIQLGQKDFPHPACNQSHHPILSLEATLQMCLAIFFFFQINHDSCYMNSISVFLDVTLHVHKMDSFIKKLKALKSAPNSHTHIFHPSISLISCSPHNVPLSVWIWQIKRFHFIPFMS